MTGPGRRSRFPPPEPFPTMSVPNAQDAKENISVARDAVSRGDLAHALFHVTTALATDPTRGEWLALAHEIAMRATDPLALAPVDAEHSSFLHAAARAYLLSTLEEFEEALGLLADAAVARPDAAFLEWAREWLRRPGVAAGLRPEFVTGTLVPRLLKMATQAPPGMAPHDPRRRNVIAADDMLLVLRHYLPNEAQAYFAGSVVARRLGAFDQAMELAHQAFEKKGDWNAAVGMALACRDAGRIDDAVGWFRHAFALSPEELSPLLDIGDAYLAAERWAHAAGAYDEVLAREPEHPWAGPSALFARHMQKPDPETRKKLWALGEHSERAWDLFCQIAPPEPYSEVVPEAADATANALRDVVRQMREDPDAAAGSRVALAVTHPEAPSVSTAFSLFRAALGVEIYFELTVERVQSPDPRMPKGAVDFVLWRYDENVPSPNLPPPDPRVTSAVAAIASARFGLEEWEERTRRLAAEMGPAWAEQLSAVMVHPPPLPSLDVDPVLWVQKTQLASALTIARLEPSFGGASKRALYSIALGPSDWSTDAALVALGSVARQDPDARKEIQGLFAWLEERVPEEGYTSWELALNAAWLGSGNLDDATRERLTAKRRELLRGQSSAVSDTVLDDHATDVDLEPQHEPPRVEA
jgi:hypothetical protein